MSIVDISERVRAEEEIRKAWDNTRYILSSIDSLLIGVSTMDTITHWNNVAEDIFGLSEVDATGQKIMGLSLKWDWLSIYEGISECFISQGPVRLTDIKYSRRDGREGMLGITINPVEDRNNAIMGFIIFGKDITDKRIMEMQLMQDQKLKSIGELAAGVAHEINTPTQYVNDNVHFLKTSVMDLMEITKLSLGIDDCRGSVKSIDEVLHQIREKAASADFEYLRTEIPLAIEQSIEGLNRISAIVKSMKSFSHPGHETLASIDINGVVNDTITISRNEWKYDADIETDLDPAAPEVLGDSAEITQVLLNIIVNASHAVKDAIKDGLIDRGKITVMTKGKAGNLVISIADNGTGTPPEVQPKIFDPFFTTKEVGRGTGQGLAISYHIIVEKHRGRLYFSTEPGRGTTFYIRLPL